MEFPPGVRFTPPKEPEVSIAPIALSRTVDWTPIVTFGLQMAGTHAKTSNGCISALYSNVGAFCAPGAIANRLGSTLLWRVPVDTEKKPDEQKTDQPKQDIGEIVGDLVVSGATLLTHSVAETVVKRVKKAAAKLAPVEAVKKVEKKAKKSAAGTKVTKAKKASKKSGPKKSTGKKAAKKSSKKTTRKKTSKGSRR
jgi:hypothetical protein